MAQVELVGTLLFHAFEQLAERMQVALVQQLDGLLACRGSGETRLRLGSARAGAFAQDLEFVE